MTDRTYGCPLCLDEGVTLEQRKHDTFGYTYTAAVPCNACQYGQDKRAAWEAESQHKGSTARPRNVVLQPSHGRDWHEPVEREP